MKTFYITSPLYYVNAKPHIGHSYTQIACDAIARYLRQSGRTVFFMTGTDEHGEKIEKATLEKGYGAGGEQRFVDEIVPAFKDLWQKLNIRYDYFIRTTDTAHVNTVQHVLTTLHAEGKIYKKTYQGWFCTPCETFWSDTQAVGGVCPDCKRPVERLDEENYFLKMSEYQTWLIDYIHAHPDFIQPDFRRNEVLGFLKEPLLDLCISRPKSRLSWGIEIPFDKNFVVYVWFDALLNYISGIGYPHDMARFTKEWPATYHVMAKDIIRHHAVYWPIILHALGIEPPQTVFAHGWWVFKGEKMSKSKGNVVDPIAMIARYGVDAYRYFLLREVTFGLDGSFSEEMVIARYNSDLANDLGNLLNRTLTMVEKYFTGVIPDGAVNDPELRSLLAALPATLDAAVPRLNFSAALVAIWAIIGRANKYIEESKPWALAKEGKDAELRSVIYALLEALRVVALGIYPVMPATAASIYAQLGFSVPIDTIPAAEMKKAGALAAGTPIHKLPPLFPRIENA